MSSYPACKFQPTKVLILRICVIKFKESNFYQILKYIFHHHTTIAQMCAYHEETDVCSGDSGGPLTYQSGNTRYQIGVVSYGNRKCGNKE